MSAQIVAVLLLLGAVTAAIVVAALLDPRRARRATMRMSDGRRSRPRDPHGPSGDP